MNELIQRYHQATPGMQVYVLLLCWLISLLITTGLVQLLWNSILPKIGPFGKISFWQTLGLMALVWLLTNPASFVQITFPQ